jgi:hypothetical protein
VKLIGIVVLQLGIGADVVIRTDPFPVDEVGESNVPFRLIVAATPLDGVTIAASWNEFPLISWGVSGEIVAKASVTPQTGPANPIPRRTSALLETTKEKEHRCADPDVGVHACEVVPLQLPSYCPGEVPACVIEIVSPATESEPVRDAADELVATLNAIEPFPTFDAGATIEMKGELLTAFQAQPAWVVTETIPVPPAAPNVAGFAGLTA